MLIVPVISVVVEDCSRHLHRFRRPLSNSSLNEQFTHILHAHKLFGCFSAIQTKFHTDNLQ